MVSSLPHLDKLEEAGGFVTKVLETITIIVARVGSKPIQVQVKLNNCSASLNIWQSYGIKFELQIGEVLNLSLSAADGSITDQCSITIIGSNLDSSLEFSELSPDLESADLDCKLDSSHINLELSDLNPNLTANLELFERSPNLEHVDPRSEIPLAISTGKIKLHSLKLNSLTITNFTEVHCIGKIVIERLDLTVDLLVNTEYLEISTANFNVATINNNNSKIYVLESLMLNLKTLTNDCGEIYSASRLNLAVDNLANAGGKISGLTGTFFKINQQFNSNQDSAIGFATANAGSITELHFQPNNNLFIVNLGLIIGAVVRFNQTAMFLLKGKVVGLKEVQLNSPNRLISMPLVEFITPKLRICAPDFHLSKQTHCQKTIVELAEIKLPVAALPAVAGSSVTVPNVASSGVVPNVASPGVTVPSVTLPAVAGSGVTLPGVALPELQVPLSPAKIIFNLTHEYHTTGKFKLSEHGINKHNIKQKMLARFGALENDVANHPSANNHESTNHTANNAGANNSTEHNHAANNPAEHNHAAYGINAEYVILLQASICATKGCKFWMPAGSLVVNVAGFKQDFNNNYQGLISLEGKVTAIATTIDLYRSGLVGQQGFMWAKDLTLGRLVADPNNITEINLPDNKVYRVEKASIDGVSFVNLQYDTYHLGEIYADHATCSASKQANNLDYSIIPTPARGCNAYQIIMHNNKVICGTAITNGSFLVVKNKLEVIGKFNVHGVIDAGELKINTAGFATIWQAAEVKVAGDCQVLGEIKLQPLLFSFKVKQKQVDLSLVVNNCGRIQISRHQVTEYPGIISYTQANSLGSSLTIDGKLSGNCRLDLQASNLFVGAKALECLINATNLEVGRPQYLHNIITGTASVPKTIFTCTIHFNKNVVLCASTQQATTIAGRFSAPNTLIISNKQHDLNLGMLYGVQHNPYYLDPINPIIDLSNKPHSIHLTFMHKDLKDTLDKIAAPSVGFLLSEGFWFDLAVSQSFYQEISNYLYLKTADDKFNKIIIDAQNNNTIFQLSPKLLLNTVQTECQERLGRRSPYADRPLNLALLQEMHRNTSEYVAYLQSMEWSAEVLNTALTVNNDCTSAINLPSKPILYYKNNQHESTHTESLEILSCTTYIPTQLLQQAGNNKIDLFNTQELFILDQDLSGPELQQQLEQNPSLQAILLTNLEDDPTLVRHLPAIATVQHKIAAAEQKELALPVEASMIAPEIAMQTEGINEIVEAIDQKITLLPEECNEISDPINQDITLQTETTNEIALPEPLNPNSNVGGKVSLAGSFNVAKLTIITPSTIELNAEITAEDLLLTSLVNDIIMHSTVHHSLGSNADHSNDKEFAQVAHTNQVRHKEQFKNKVKLHVKNICQIYAGKNISIQSAELTSKVKTEIMALGNILDLPVEVIEEQIEHSYAKRQYQAINKTIHHQQGSLYKSDGEVIIVAGQHSVLTAPVIQADNFSVTSGGNAILADASELIELATYNKNVKRILGFKHTKEKLQRANKDLPKGAVLDVTGEVSIVGQQAVKLMHTTSNAKVNKLTSLGEVTLAAAKEYIAEEEAMERRNAWWLRRNEQEITTINYAECYFSGIAEITAERINVELVKDEDSKLSVNNLSASERAASELLDHLKITAGELQYKYVEPKRQRTSRVSEQPGPLTISMAALAASVLTSGTCSALAATILSHAGTWMHAMLSAGLRSICAQAAGELMANKGDPGKAIKALLKKNHLKELTISMLSAGALHPVAKILAVNPAGVVSKSVDLSTDCILRDLQYNLAKAGVNATLNLLDSKAKAKNCLTHGLIDALVSATLSPVLVELNNLPELSKLNNLQELNKIQAINQQLFNSVLGGIKGLIKNKDPLEGLVTGIAEEVVATACQGLVNTIADLVNELKNKRLIAERQKLLAELLRLAIQEGLQEELKESSELQELQASLALQHKIQADRKGPNNAPGQGANVADSAEDLQEIYTEAAALAKYKKHLSFLANLAKQRTVDPNNSLPKNTTAQQSSRKDFGKLAMDLLFGQAAYADELPAELTSEHAGLKSEHTELNPEQTAIHATKADKIFDMFGLTCSDEILTMLGIDCADETSNSLGIEIARARFNALGVNFFDERFNPLGLDLPKENIDNNIVVSSPNFRVIDQAQSSNRSSKSSPHTDKILVALPDSETAANKWKRLKKNVSSPKSRITDQEQATSSSSSTISNIVKIPLALALPFTLISSTAYASENTEGTGSNRTDPSSSSNTRTSWLSKAHRAFKGERSPEILEWQNINRASASSIAVGFDGINDGEQICNTKLQNSKKVLHEWVDDGLKDVNNRLCLESLDLSISDKFILHSKKLAFQTTSSAVQHVVPGSTSELREKVLAGVIGSELYFMYKLGEEFKIPGTNVKVAPLGNRKNDPIGKWPHYHRRVPDPKKPNDSLPGQSKYRHKPWESSKSDKKFTDRF